MEWQKNESVIVGRKLWATYEISPSNELSFKRPVKSEQPKDNVRAFLGSQFFNYRFMSKWLDNPKPANIYW